MTTTDNSIINFQEEYDDIKQEILESLLENIQNDGFLTTHQIPERSSIFELISNSFENVIPIMFFLLILPYLGWGHLCVVLIASYLLLENFSHDYIKCAVADYYIKKQNLSDEEKTVRD